MVQKTVTYTGTGIKNTDDIWIGFNCNNENNMYIEADENATSARSVYAATQHIVTESNNPIWNNVSYDIVPVLNYGTSESGSDTYNGHVTLQGITDDGTIVDIMQHQYDETTSTSETKSFELTASSCTSAAYNKTSGGATTGTIDITLPLKYENYESAVLIPSWYNTDWTYRIGLQLAETYGPLHGVPGHKKDYYGITIYVPYKTGMNTDFSDIRFTGPDGITELSYYILEYTASTSASVLVMVPYVFMDQSEESTATITSASTTTYTYSDPQYLYCYYGNSDAASASDISLGGQALLYDDFDDNSLDTDKWTETGTSGYCTETSNGLEIRVPPSATDGGSITADIGTEDVLTTSGFDVIVKYSYIYPLTTTTTSEGPLVRIRNKDETSSYTQARSQYVAAADTHTGGGTAGHHWGVGYANAGSSGTPQYTYYMGTTNTKSRYIRFRYKRTSSSSSTDTGSNNLVWYTSNDGVKWDEIYHVQHKSTVFGTTGGIAQLLLGDAGAGGTATKLVYIDSIVAYPTMGNNNEFDMCGWTNGADTTSTIYSHDKLHMLNTSSSNYRSATTAENKITLAHTSPTGTCIWNDSYQNGILAYVNNITILSPNPLEDEIYECTITSNSQGAVSGLMDEGGICLFDSTTLSGSNSQLFGVRWLYSSTSRVFYRETFASGASSITNSFGSWTTTDFPISLRITVDHTTKTMYFDVKKAGGEWMRMDVSANAYKAYVSNTYTMCGIYYRNATTNSGSVSFSNWRMYDNQLPNGSGYIGNSTASTSAWTTPETYTEIETTTTDTDLITLSFPSTNITHRGTPYQLRTQIYGEDYSYTKIIYLTDADSLAFGADGVDKYIGMKLEFDFDLGPSDSFEVDNIYYTYEVL